MTTNGLVVEGGRARYTGVLADRLSALAPELAAVFQVATLAEALESTARLRDRLMRQAAVA